MPSSSSTRWSLSTSDGCVGRCRSIQGAGLVGVEVEGDGDDAEAERFEFFVERLPHGQVSANSLTTTPRRRAAPCVRASQSGRTGCRRCRAVRSVGTVAVVRARPPLSGPSAQIPAASSATSAMPSRSATAATSSGAVVADRARNRHTGHRPCTCPPGLATHPVASAKASAVRSSESSSIGPLFQVWTVVGEVSGPIV